uniref:Acyl-CoA dehydrogenase/oxidase C-terminal domain-containing protein n=1 Tax=Aplanochytrium stocchinoi TaxID=215587 RepID=A0A7S3LN19_9STRA
MVDRLPGNVKPEEFDYFHELITHEEVSRLMTPGFQDGCFGGKNISITPLLVFGTKRMREEIVPKSLKGLCKTVLAITEPFAGSDVAGIRTTAKKTPCGQFYIVNGVKKWITEGYNADYYISAVRTGGPGKGGISMLLIEKGEGVSTKLIKTSYASSAETSYVIFENVKVPVENLMAKENEGFRAVMYNFNHERWYIVVSLLARCRFVLEECFKWASQRQIFGKSLISHGVIQEKFARMASGLEACYYWLEMITNQMNKMTFEEYNAKIGGDIALLKFNAAQVARTISEESVQIFGGRGVSSTGMGKYIERFQRTTKIPAVYGGSSEIMASLAVRQAVRSFPKDAKL